MKSPDLPFSTEWNGMEWKHCKEQLKLSLLEICR